MRMNEQEFLAKLLAQHKSNLQILKLQKSKYGAGEVPLILLNQIEHEMDIIEELETQIKSLGSRSGLTQLLPLEPFPHDDWRAVNHFDWEQTTIDWFCTNYEEAPYGTMEQLLNHVFDVIRNVQDTPSLLKNITELGHKLQNCIPMNSPVSLAHPHHQTILLLLEKGLHRQHSHLFMLPQIYMSNLLNIPDYSRLLMSIKLHAVGDYKNAIELVRGIARGCCLAQYIRGQSERRIGMYMQAQVHLDEARGLLDNWEVHKCPFNEGLEIICNQYLLEAMVLRAKAVVFRKLNNRVEAENFFRMATESAVKNLRGLPPRIETPSVSELAESDTIWADYEQDSALRVIADVHFGHGYYWYSKRDYEEAKNLFELAIDALKRADERWDSPYTRLAVVELCLGDYQKAMKLFSLASDICENTSIERNREAPLSFALCTLGLKVIENSYPVVGQLTTRDPQVDLENAIKSEPKLSLGPLQCHRDDAKHFLIDTLKSSQTIVNKFIRRLDQEIDMI